MCTELNTTLLVLPIPWSLHVRWNKRGMCIERTITLNVTELNLELGAPLTHLNHLSTSFQVSDEPSVKSAFVRS